MLIRVPMSASARFDAHSGLSGSSDMADILICQYGVRFRADRNHLSTDNDMRTYLSPEAASLPAVAIMRSPASR